MDLKGLRLGTYFSNMIMRKGKLEAVLTNFNTKL